VALCVVHPLLSTKTLKDEKARDTTNTGTPKTCRGQTPFRIQDYTSTMN